MNILKKSICNKICERYEQYGDKFTFVQASKRQEPIVMIGSVEQAKACAHVQAAYECGYPLVFQVLVCAVPLMRYRDHDRVHQMVYGSVDRRHERATAILITSPI